jgi:hypothetical protein
VAHRELKTFIMDLREFSQEKYAITTLMVSCDSRGSLISLFASSL